MKAIMRQYAGTIVAVVIGVALFAIIYELPIWGEDGIGGKVLKSETVTAQEDGSALESYWRSK
jgi:hypothetical protein